MTLPLSGVFKGYTLAELRSLTLRMLRVVDTVRFSPTGTAADYDWIDDALNRGQEDFVRKTLCLRTDVIIELKGNQRTYRLPDDFLDLMAVYYYDNSLENGYRELTITTIRDLNDEINDWRNNVDKPKKIYIDREYGMGTIFGLYPIPAVDGDAVTFNSAFGCAVTWVCPLYTFNQDIGVITRVSGVDEWILPTQSGVSVDIDVENGNLILQYYRLPQILIAQGGDAIQVSEIPREYQKSLAYYAVSDLLTNNPSDSAEFKRAAQYMQMFQAEVMIYINKRKRSLAGRYIRGKALAWTWLNGMPSFQELK